MKHTHTHGHKYTLKITNTMGANNKEGSGKARGSQRKTEAGKKKCDTLTLLTNSDVTERGTPNRKKGGGGVLVKKY